MAYLNKSQVKDKYNIPKNPNNIVTLKIIRSSGVLFLINELMILIIGVVI
jgi:hypothetical protein